MPPSLQTLSSARREDTDTLRAIACIALVSFHVVGVSADSGMELPDAHWMRRANAAIADVSILVLPYAHFWFLQATFVIMALVLLAGWATGDGTGPSPLGSGWAERHSG